MKGSYIIVIYLHKETRIVIGALGKISFNKGFHIYVGSAMGTSGSTTLENRVKRHLLPSKNKKIHWHIDYLLENNNSNITTLYLIPTIYKLECHLAKELLMVSNGHINGFGSSDCKCQSHLFYFKEFLDLSKLSLGTE